MSHMDVAMFRAYRALPEGPKKERLLGVLCKDNDPLVKTFVARCARAHRMLVDDDLLQYGRIGLVKAFRTFDENTGAFSTWVWNKVRNEVQEGIAKDVPFARVKYKRKLHLIGRAEILFLTKHGRMPSAEELGVSEGALAAHREHVSVRSLDEMNDNEEGPRDDITPREPHTAETLLEDVERQGDDKGALVALCKYLAWLPAKERIRFSRTFLGDTPANDNDPEVKQWVKELRTAIGHHRT